MLYRDLLILYYKYNLHLTLLNLEFISRVNFSCELQTSESNFLLNIFTRMFHKHCHNSVSKTQHLFIYLFFQIAFYCHCLCHSLHTSHYPLSKISLWDPCNCLLTGCPASCSLISLISTLSYVSDTQNCVISVL